QIELELIHTKSHESKNTPEEYMISFYKTFDDVKDQNWDGLIITGAPVELMPFEEVEYWDELVEIMEWSKTNVHSTFHICWGAQAGLYYHYGINKRIMDEKMFGVFPHVLEKKKSILFRGSDDIFYVPHSRHTTVDRELIEKDPRLKIIASSDEAGVYAIHTDGGKQVFIMGHSEYDPRTLEKEYLRDKNAGLEIAVPKNYYPNDDDTKDPLVTWRAHANLLYSNWLNYFVYQTSPYDITRISNENVAYPEPIKLD
ncbi:MAG: homoserine O-succinyltransferase, partial [Anaerotignum sp.]|nr:homoserine O-succinyltransferase [Anaerotignum sp.]